MNTIANAIATTVDPGALASQPSLSRIRSHIVRMSGLSTTAMKVLRICNEPSVCANDLNRVVGLDPVLTGRILQLINSAYYSLPSKVNSLTRAIILLGINTVKNVVLSFAIFETFSKRDAFRVISSDEFWAHSLSTAVTAKLLAIRQGIPRAEQEDFFVSGLMHDIGKIPLNQLFPEAYREAAQQAESSQIGMRLAEEERIGTDHCQVGLMIARKWQLSENLADALAGHHSNDDADSQSVRLKQTVALADRVAHCTGATIPGGISLEGQGRDWMVAHWPFCDGEGALAELSAAVSAEVEKAKVFLEIANRS
jgi:putative nucleotidyltransferase with HDIG domain